MVCQELCEDVVWPEGKGLTVEYGGNTESSCLDLITVSRFKCKNYILCYKSPKLFN